MSDGEDGFRADAPRGIEPQGFMPRHLAVQTDNRPVLLQPFLRTRHESGAAIDFSEGRLVGLPPVAERESKDDPHAEQSGTGKPSEASAQWAAVMTNPARSGIRTEGADRLAVKTFVRAYGAVHGAERLGSERDSSPGRIRDRVVLIEQRHRRIGHPQQARVRDLEDIPRSSSP